MSLDMGCSRIPSGPERQTCRQRVHIVGYLVRMSARRAPTAGLAYIHRPQRMSDVPPEA